jgi:hypothetical protein
MEKMKDSADGIAIYDNESKLNRHDIAKYIYNKTNPIKPYIIKDVYSVCQDIPLNIYMVWHSQELPPKMKENLDMAIIANPEFNFYIYNENDCRIFIRDNYDQDVLNAFDRLNPIAYKADLFRYCVLYALGGIYIDIKIMPVNGFKFIHLMDRERFTLERDGFYWDKDVFGINNGFIIVKPRNEILLDCINEIVDSVKNSYYGFNCLYPTGPGLLGLKYFKHKKSFDEIDLFFTSIYKIQLGKNLILESYPEYLEEKKVGNEKNYGTLYDEKKIYL